MKPWAILFLICSFLILFSELALAHKASDSYLRFKIDGKTIHGQWDIALRDLDYAIGLDDDGNGQITWGELRVKHQAISNYALPKIQLSGNGSNCQHNPANQLVDHHTDGAYTVLNFSAVCSEVIRTFEINYSFLFDLDPQHRGLLQLDSDGKVQTGVLSPEQQTLSLDLKNSAAWNEFLQFTKEGVWHIWIGYDHILFLLSLLLPAVLCWQLGRWQPQRSFRVTLWEVLKIVTAFTLAHSITLSLAVVGVVSLPSQWVESAIAASVLIAALHNLYPVIHTHLWIMTFIFGLVHGLGFASVLIDLGLPSQSLALALAGFNLGVEIGQVIIVSVFTPMAFLIRHSWSYQRLVLNFGSTAIALIALIWLVERSLDINFGIGVS